MGRELASRKLDRYELAHAGEQTFESLSGGAQEQLGVLSRLACARLVDGADGAPVIFDDALGHSDPTRLGAMADALVEAGHRPDLIVGDMDSVSDAALTSGAELLVHAYRDGRAPGLSRVEELGIDPGPELRDLEQAVLLQDPRLLERLPRPVLPAAPVPPELPELPEMLAVLVVAGPLNCWYCAPTSPDTATCGM